MIKWSALYLQDGISFTGESLNCLIDWVTIIIVSILMAVIWFYIRIQISKTLSNHIIDSQFIEFGWTCFPLIILYCIASISLKALYVEDSQSLSPCLNFNVTGHQWYWEYYYPDFNITFDSYLQEWESRNFRLSDCDNRVVLPFKTPVRVSVTSADVIHSWAIPSLGIKIDATPGRIVSTIYNPIIPGLAYGLCAELCGANHSFMPITIEHTSLLLFKKWVYLITTID